MSLFDLLRQPSPETPWTFLERWHGEPTREPDPIQAGDLPESVRAFAAGVTRWPNAIVQNGFANDPDDMRDGDKRVGSERPLRRVVAARTSKPLARLSAIPGVRWDREPGSDLRN